MRFKVFWIGQFGNDTVNYTCGSLFSGIGGFCFGFAEAKIQTVWATDFDEQVAKTYRHNFPKTNFLHESIENLDLSDFEAVDVVHAGFPCQSFSQAGDRKGFDDPRGQLFNVMMDKFASSSWLPSILVFENSPFLMIGDQGLWFEHIRTRLNELGYWFTQNNAITIDTQTHCGLPQKRERLFMFACHKSHFDFNWFNFNPKKVPLRPIENFLQTEQIHASEYYLGDENKYGKMLTDAAKNLKKNQLLQLRKYYFREIEYGTCPTLTANMGTGGHNVPFLLDDIGLRRLTERECLNLQGFPASFDFPEGLPKTARYRMIGNAVSPAVSSLIGQEIIKVLEDRLDGYELAV